MVDWKLEYLAMKMKYINLIGGKLTAEQIKKKKRKRRQKSSPDRDDPNYKKSISASQKINLKRPSKRELPRPVVPRRKEVVGLGYRQKNDKAQKMKDKAQKMNDKAAASWFRIKKGEVCSRDPGAQKCAPGLTCYQRGDRDLGRCVSEHDNSLPLAQTRSWDF
mgnify:CR=1 FL=1